MDPAPPAAPWIQDGLTCREADVVEQALPGGQAGDRQRGGPGAVRGVLGQGAVARPVSQSEHPLADGQAVDVRVLFTPH
jgi:hypothetical protein